MQIYDGVNHYPKWVYSKRLDVTRENMRIYDEKERKFYATLDEMYPDYYNGQHTREEKDAMWNHVADVCKFEPEF